MSKLIPNKFFKAVILRLILSYCCSGFVAGDCVAAPTAAVQEIPEGLQACLSELSRETMADIPELKKRWGTDFQPEFTLEHYQKVIDFRDGSSPAWLIGYCVGTDSPFGHKYNRICIMTENKEAIFSLKTLAPLGFDEEGGCEAATLVALAPKQYALALSETVDESEDGVVTIISLAPSPRIILKFQPDKKSTNACETSFYFADLNGDGIQEIIADSTFTRPDTGKEVGKTISILSINPKTKVYEVTKAFPEKTAKSIVASRKNPDIVQFSRPVNISDEPRRLTTRHSP
jgi:hypothetical protein